MPSAYFPTTQLAQVLAPEFGVKVPRAQGVGSIEPAEHADPAAATATDDQKDTLAEHADSAAVATATFGLRPVCQQR